MNTVTMQPPTAAAPLSAVARQLADTVSKKEATALKVWRQAVRDAAENKELTAKRMEELADAMFTLNRTAGEFDARVNDYRTLAGAREALAGMPTREQDKAEREKLAARNKEIDEIIVKLRQEKGENAGRYQYLGTPRVNATVTIERLERELAELLADD